MTHELQKVEKASMIKFIILYMAIIFIFFAIGPWIFCSNLISSSDFHSAIEIIGSFIALITGTACLMCFFRLESRFFLVVGLGFFICGSENFVHGILSYERIFTKFGIDFSKFTTGTYLAGRITLAVMIIAALLLEHITKKIENIKREAAIFSSIAVLLGGSLTVLALKINLLQFIYPDWFISRPVDLIPALLFLIAVPLILKRYFANKDVFSGMLLASVLFNIGGQFYMSFSRLLFDAFHDVSHIAAVFSYMMPLLGISLQEKTEISKVSEELSRRKIYEQRLTSLNRLIGSLFRIDTLDKKFKSISDGVVEIFDADFCRIWISKPGDLCDSSCVHAKIKQGPHVCRYRESCLHLMTSSGRYTHINSETHRRVPFGCYKIGRIASGELHKFLTNEVTNEPRIHNRNWAKELGLVSFAGYQLLSDSFNPIGVLALFSKHIISPEEDALLEMIAGTTAQVIQTTEAQSELKFVNEKLVETAHKVGMAEVAADVLHNVGNVLNSINVSTTMINDKVANSELVNLEKVACIINENIDNIGTFLTEDPQGKHIPVYLMEVSKALICDQTDIIEKLGVLTKNIRHIKDIISMQQEYAKVSGMEFPTSLTSLVEDAIQINCAGLERHGTKLIRDFRKLPDIEIARQKVLLVLVNLISNAKYAVSGSNKKEKIVIIRLYKYYEDRIRIEVTDNGVGIAKENLARIFDHGFTTKEHGHGFGLHSCILASRELGGSLTAHSDGIGQGATFTLELPFKPAEIKNERRKPEE